MKQGFAIFGFTAFLGACGTTASGGNANDAAVNVTDAPAVTSIDGSTAETSTPLPEAGVGEAGGDLVSRLLALTSNCKVASNGKYAIHAGLAPTIDVCGLNGAFFWSSSMNVDCDGQTTTECSIQTDPAYQPDTSFHQKADGKPLIASVLPYVVVPLPSTRWDYNVANVQPGALVIVLYGNNVNYGVFGDEGPADLIGEASYAMAKSLGVNPDPKNGGAESGATYIVLTGQGAVVDPIEDHHAAVMLGQTLALQLLQKN